LIRVALDALGADKAPVPEIEGTIMALRNNPELEVIFVGKKEVIEPALSQHDTTGLKYRIHHCTEVVEMADKPGVAIKTKRDSSLVQCVELQKKGLADASVSAGNTGAFMGAALFGLGRIECVCRPAIAIAIPTVTGQSLMLDMGANADCRPQHLFEFARMGQIYVERMWNIQNPKVGLLSVGEESSKGNEAVVTCHQLLLKSNMNFIGNVEGNDILFGKSDVISCDGFVGNVLLKFYESIPGLLKSTLGDLLRNEKAKGFLEKFNKESYGGAELLGINGVVIVSHGSSTPISIKNALDKACKMVSTKVNEVIKTVMTAEAANTTNSCEA
jgi:glycerol-3-phosphate acyltransferase PlsX